jgi:hypothetical protein
MSLAGPAWPRSLPGLATADRCAGPSALVAHKSEANVPRPWSPAAVMDGGHCGVTERTDRF